MKRDSFKKIGYVNMVTKDGEVIGWFTLANIVLEAIPENANIDYIQAVLDKVSEIEFSCLLNLMFVARESKT